MIIKRYITGILIFILTATFSSYSQEVQFPASVLTAGGGTNHPNNGSISKWRIGKVHVLESGSEGLKHGTIAYSTGKNRLINDSWEIKAYPNPVKDVLSLHFAMDNTTQAGINVSDLAGRKLLFRKSQPVNPGDEVTLNLTGLAPAIYLVHIRSNDLKINKVIKIIKN